MKSEIYSITDGEYIKEYFTRLIVNFICNKYCIVWLDLQYINNEI